jgi:hypothetical protein
MNSNWLYDQNALTIVVVLMGTMMLAAGSACRLGRRWHPQTHDAGREVFVAVKVSLLGLLALLLAFTFEMAARRYEERQRLVLDEATVLHEIFLQSRRLPEPPRADFQQTLRRYVEARLAFFDARRDLAAVEEAIDRTEALHARMWDLVVEVAQRQPPPPGVDALTRSLNQEWSLHRQRVHAFENRVPDAVVLLLFGGAIVAMVAVGFSAGIANHRGAVGRFLLAGLICATIFVVLDLDRPRRGLFRLSQGPMLHLQQILERAPQSDR